MLTGLVIVKLKLQSKSFVFTHNNNNLAHTHTHTHLNTHTHIHTQTYECICRRTQTCKSAAGNAFTDAENIYQRHPVHISLIQSVAIETRAFVFNEKD